MSVGAVSRNLIDGPKIADSIVNWGFKSGVSEVQFARLLQIHQPALVLTLKRLKKNQLPDDLNLLWKMLNVIGAQIESFIKVAVTPWESPHDKCHRCYVSTPVSSLWPIATDPERKRWMKDNWIDPVICDNCLSDLQRELYKADRRQLREAGQRQLFWDWMEGKNAYQS